MFKKTVSACLFISLFSSHTSLAALEFVAQSQTGDINKPLHQFEKVKVPLVVPREIYRTVPTRPNFPSQGPQHTTTPQTNNHTSCSGSFYHEPSALQLPSVIQEKSINFTAQNQKLIQTTQISAPVTAVTVSLPKGSNSSIEPTPKTLPGTLLRKTPNSTVVLASELPVRTSKTPKTNAIKISAAGRVSFVAFAENNNAAQLSTSGGIDQNKFIEFLKEQIKIQVSQGNYTGSANGSVTDPVFSELFQVIRSAFRQGVANALFPNQAFPLPGGSIPPSWMNLAADSPLWPGTWTNWPSTWDDATWSRFMFYLENLPEDTKTQLRGNPLYNPDSGDLRPESGWGWEARRTLWEQVVASLNLPAGEINFDFETELNGQTRTVEVKGTWGQYFRDLFENGLWEARWKIREAAPEVDGTGNNGNGGSSGGSSNNSNNQSGSLGSLQWSVTPLAPAPVPAPLPVQPTPTSPTPNNSTPTNDRNRLGSIIMATVGPSLVFGIPAAGTVVTGLSTPPTIGSTAVLGETVTAPEIPTPFSVPLVVTPTGYIQAVPETPTAPPGYVNAKVPVYKKAMW